MPPSECGPVLYLSYDGMTDPLGESQVIPYLAGLSRHGYRFHILSFEKPRRMEREGARIRAHLDDLGIHWHPLSFTARPRLLAKAFDALRFRQAAFRLHRKHGFAFTHCRSYVSAAVGLRLLRSQGIPYLFDMRGFWVDERVEGGIWNPALPHYRLLYRFFKRRELDYLGNAAAVVSLTERAVAEMRTWPGLESMAVEVIPCCVETELFSPRDDPSEEAGLRAELGIPPTAPVVTYLGSIGTWYMLEEMLALFRAWLAREPEARFLFITTHDPDDLRQRAREGGIDPGRVVVRSATRGEVPALASLGSFSVFFIRPTFSKTASCPTKLGELMALGVPIVCNAGVGDVDDIVRTHGAGLVIPDTEPPTLRKAAESLADLDGLPRERMVEGARSYFSLQQGVESYRRIYQRLLGTEAGP